MRDRSLANAQGALSEIRKIREGKIKASDAYTLKDNDIFEEVDEEVYQNIIKERRSGNFVVDDNGIGYEDDGRDLMDNYIPLPSEISEGKRNDRKRRKEHTKKGLNEGSSILKQFQFIPEEMHRGNELKTEQKHEAKSKSMDILSALKDFDDSLFEDIDMEGEENEKYGPEDFEMNKKNMKAHDMFQLDTLNKLTNSDLCENTFAIDEEESMEQNPSYEQNEHFVSDNVIKDQDLEVNQNEYIEEQEIQGRDCKYMKFGEEPINKIEKKPSGIQTQVYTSEEGSLNFYLMEVTEDLGTGELYLFGKIMTVDNYLDDNKTINTESCCIVIKETWRSLYIYPRESAPNHPDPISVSQNVAKEILEIRKEYRIPKIQMKPVVRNFCFSQKDVKYGPNQPFLKLIYSSKNPSLPLNLSGETFSHIFGLNTSLTENFIIKREIKGPSWLIISKPYQLVPVGGGRKSQCRLEIHVPNWKTIRPWAINSNCNKMDDSNKVQKAENSNFEKILTSSPLLTITCLNVCSRLPSNGSNNPEIYSISMITIKNVNIDDAQWDEINSSEILKKRRAPGNVDIHTWTGIRRHASSPFPIGSEEKMEKSGIKYFSTERSLLLAFVTSFSQLDPDIVVGHNIWTDHLDVLVSRMVNIGVPNFWKLGKIFTSVQNQKQSIKSLSSTKRIQSVFQGRIICDTCLSSREFMKSRIDYQLNSIFSEVFPQDLELKKASIMRSASAEAYYLETYKSFETISKSLTRDLLVSVGVFKLLFHLQVLPLTRELTNLAGFLWSKSLLFLRAERNEYLLLHEFHKGKFVTPDCIQRSQKYKIRAEDSLLSEIDKEDNHSKKEETYSGGLVLEPVTGLYDSFILLLDFNSLYPSIIQEFKICFTTREPTKLGSDTTEDAEGSSLIDRGSSSNQFDNTILPGILESLVKRRRHIKEILKNMPSSTRKIQLEIRQLALKLTANSLYGCLGYKNSRFYAKDLASIITFYGRQILQKTKLKVEDETKLQVIYGDTDSIMVNTSIYDDGNGEGYSLVLKLASQIKQIVNKDYTKLELDLDGVLQRLLLLKKKKYACIQIVDFHRKQFKLECKGLDLVRRDWSILTRNVSTQILNLLFSNEPIDIVITSILNTLESLNETLNSNSIPVESFIITKTLTKLPQFYSDPYLLPHVIVAKRMISSGLPVSSGTEIPYIICKEELNLHTSEEAVPKSSMLSKRAYSPEEVKSNGLNIDIEWYKTQQLLPPLSRLCAPIPGLEISRIGQCLGLEYKQYSEIIQKEDSEHLTDSFSTFEWKKNPETYISVPITANIDCFQCIKKGNSGLNSVFNLLKENRWECQACNNQFPPEFLSNWLHNHLRTLTLRYYSAFHGICRECNTQTRRVPLKNGFNCPQPHCQTKKSLTSDLSPHKIWLYLDHWLFWLSANENNNSSNQKYSYEMDSVTQSLLKDIILNFMNINKYNHIQINDLFTLLKGKDKRTKTCSNEYLLTNLWSKNTSSLG
ncbi:DNA polymerase alpha catalytic subunit [Cryptosporidium ubiquitum]|uniref:DNA polymerase n=1 Tax=Cryptosporidium ubiquitum TaxID=857276 RepID=A0A1J4MK45_9CRYT|nr:DNA polymerase alpha catalytic subunit [Cryptosporidium ubiquitum]OII74391.1 DNA polymerase alpha catalytic subunit [Cryptosporidium ubiquitum]